MSLATVEIAQFGERKGSIERLIKRLLVPPRFALLLLFLTKMFACWHTSLYLQIQEKGLKREKSNRVYMYWFETKVFILIFFHGC